MTLCVVGSASNCGLMGPLLQGVNFPLCLTSELLGYDSGNH